MRYGSASRAGPGRTTWRRVVRLGKKVLGAKYFSKFC
jgi:hypothetical protein